MSDRELEEIRDQAFGHLRQSRALMIVETAEGFEVWDHSPTGIAPPSCYPTKREAAARLLQLLGIGPVAPQTWPEAACIGSVDGAGGGA